MKFNEQTRLKIKDAILNYCEGINHMEFGIEKLDDMINDIESVIEDPDPEPEPQTNEEKGMKAIDHLNDAISLIQSMELDEEPMVETTISMAIEEVEDLL